ncbi:hypothetical protein BEWA_023090 [Theileria equi strain WA]|uniref:Uncharacterized protein n=1 Tax=Theileria equi strain WA TaxID=1537102 RepID=L0AWR9_THEEQ|nr:hypothetical protein BEWA_023090 [Theileria equi strain WA]AFZ79461.1 hypothetical protein BEWA_023090 [Theileria equi strain WA]|eukprot:XP_004829127.1 hypothetical protein BEWA_023090 [Theileria equi strain WA]
MSISQLEKSRFEIALSSNLKIHEYGTFDYAAPLNGRAVRLYNILIPRETEVLLRILSSPILQTPPYTLSFTHDKRIMRHLGFVKNLVKLPVNGTAYSTIIAILLNNQAILQHIKDDFKPQQTWPTYLDNIAAYTNIWNHVCNFFSIKLVDKHDPVRQYSTFVHDKSVRENQNHLSQLYLDEAGNLYRFKYKLSYDKGSLDDFSALLGHWNDPEVSREFIGELEDSLNGIDRSDYPFEFFKPFNTHDLSDEDFLPFTRDLIENAIKLNCKLTWKEAIDKESEMIARATIKFLNLLLYRMLESHDIPVGKLLRNRLILHRERDLSHICSSLRRYMNFWKLSKQQFSDITIDADVEELIFESSTKYRIYWSLKNDSLYNRSMLEKQTTLPSGLIFNPDDFYTRLANISGDKIDFGHAYKILCMITQDVTYDKQFPFSGKTNVSKIVYSEFDIIREQTRALSGDMETLYRGRCKCLMAFLYLIGVPDKKGNLELPNGWPRDIDKAIQLLINGMSTQCGLCNALLGFLSGIGYPQVSDNMYSWETQGDGESTIYQLLSAKNKEKVKRRPLPPTSWYSMDFSRISKSVNKSFAGLYEKFHKMLPIYNPVQETPVSSPSRPGFDVTLLSYLSGTYKRDETATLAYAYYIHSGIGNSSRLCEKHAQSGLPRPPKKVGEACLNAIPYAIEAAKSAMARHGTFQDASDEYRSRKYAEFIKKLAQMGDADGLRVLGDFHFYGHEAGGIERDPDQALYYWSQAAESGDPSSALAVAHHYMSGLDSSRMNPEDAAMAERFLRMITRSPSHAATAQFYLARYGLGQPRDPILAARWLRESADRGDINSQVLMGHAFSGLLPDVTPLEGRNVFMSFYYYRRAAKNGNIIGMYNSAVFTLHGYDLERTSAIDRCNEAYTLFTKVARMGTIPLALKVLGARARHLEDYSGYTLSSMFLSELGDPDAHKEAAMIFKNNKSLCYAPEDYSFDTMQTQNRDSETAISELASMPSNYNIPCSCYYYYSRRGAHSDSNKTPLLLAEALLSGSPWKPAEAIKFAKESSDSKGVYMHATMLEAGLGAPKNCDAAFELFQTLLDSQHKSERMLGLMCILRSKILYRLKGFPSLYTTALELSYDHYVIPTMNKADYIPCDFPLIKQTQAFRGIGVISTVYIALLFFVIYMVAKVR